jgi:uncharacterized protein YndB with AHSA1/START domain
MNALEFVVERDILIRARVQDVFRYFTDSERWAAWWGAGSRIEPRPGGEVLIRYPNAATASGRVIEMVPERRVVMSYGYDAPGSAVPSGSSRLTVTFEVEPGGTRVRLRHEVADAAVRDEHVQGWRYQMAVFANVVSREAHADAASRMDRFFEVWNQKDAARRRADLAAIAAESLAFHDNYSCTSGVEDLAAHIGAAQFFMPDMELRRRGEPRSCQGTAIVDWVATAPDGTEKAHGFNVFDFGPDGRIVRVVGLWA